MHHPEESWLDPSGSIHAETGDCKRPGSRGGMADGRTKCLEDEDVMAVVLGPDGANMARRTLSLDERVGRSPPDW
jgi:hypothetical protein